jgi:hypothetical protein
MASIEPKTNNLGDAVTTRHNALTIHETHETIRKPGTVTSHCIIMAAYNIGLLSICDTNKHKKKIT